jgi:putative spermidine/putrescine transport system substrate-binding protein
VVGGAASHKNVRRKQVVIPNRREEIRRQGRLRGLASSLVNLEKMQKNKGSQYLSVVQMDDPVMIPAVKPKACSIR